MSTTAKILLVRINKDVILTDTAIKLNVKAGQIRKVVKTNNSGILYVLRKNNKNSFFCLVPSEATILREIKRLAKCHK